MSFELLKKNIKYELDLVKRLETLIHDSKIGQNQRDKIAFQNAINATEKQIKLLNDSLPPLIDNIKLTKPLSPENNENKEVSKEVISVSHPINGSDNIVAIMKGDKNKYLDQLQIAESSLKYLRKQRKHGQEELVNEYKRPNFYISFANKLFLRSSTNAIEKGYFKELKDSLKRGNFTTLLNSYISMMFLTTFLAGILGILIAVFFIFVGISLESPYIYLVDFSKIDIGLRILGVIWIIPLVPLVTFLSLYFYPSAEKSSIERYLDYELPFATIQMAAIAGANIEPSNIFRIIALSKEYPHIRNEAKKLMNQINLYGYDLVTALHNVALASPSKSWADLLNGISTTIRSGGDLSKYLSKKAESLLFEYRLKREKATKAAETFMDIYISVVIAAPMLMMLLLIMINISNIGFSMPIPVLSIIVVSIVSLINIIFLVFLHLSQKKL